MMLLGIVGGFLAGLLTGVFISIFMLTHPFADE